MPVLQLKALLTSRPPEEDAVDIDVVEDREAYSLICPLIEHDRDTAHRVANACRARRNRRVRLIQVRRSQLLPRPARFNLGFDAIGFDGCGCLVNEEHEYV